MKLTQLKHVISLYAFLLVVWGFYRALFILPEAVDELLLKPVLWLLPTLWLVRKEGLGLPSLGVSGKNLFKSIYLAIGFGVVFASIGVLANYLKYGQLQFLGLEFTQLGFSQLLGLSFATAVSEETVFRGYIFNRLNSALKNEAWANLTSTLGWGVIHLPVFVFVYQLAPFDILTRFLLTSLFGAGSAFVFARTQNLASSILLHVLWSWPIILFR